MCTASSKWEQQNDQHRRGVVLLFARGVNLHWGVEGNLLERDRKKEKVKQGWGEGMEEKREKRERRVVKKLVHIVMDPGNLQSAQEAGR